LSSDLLLVNGVFYTMDPSVPVASAAAIRDGRIAAVGDAETVRALAGNDTPALDLGGRPVLPAFTDAHIHLVNYGLGLTQVQLDGVPSLQYALARVGERARSTPPGQWIRGWGWNRNLWPDVAFPTRHDLDGVSPHNPVLLRSKDGHAAWANSQALDLANLHPQTADPRGGALQRDPQSGDLTGILLEDPAIDLVKAAAGPFSQAEMEDAVRAACGQLHAFGIVAVHVPEGREELSALQSLWKAGELDLRIDFMIPNSALEAALELGLGGGLGDDFLRLSAVKVYADGSLGSRTADMFDGYEDEPANRGIEVTGDQRLNEIVGRACAGGWSVAIHALGDRANSRVLDALERHWAVWSKTGLRPRIEHVQLLSPQDLPRLSTMGVVASMQPIHCTSDMVMADRHWGRRCEYAYAWRRLLDSGAVLAFGSDAPVEVPDVLRGIFAAVTRQREDGYPTEGWWPEQRLTVAEAVYAYTQGAAYAAGHERDRGSITVGKLADLVVLSRDIFERPVSEILCTQVDLTVLGGEVVHQRS